MDRIIEKALIIIRKYIKMTDNSKCFRRRNTNALEENRFIKIVHVELCFKLFF